MYCFLTLYIYNLIDGVFLFHIHQLYKRYNYIYIIYIKKALKLCWGYYYYYYYYYYYCEQFGKKKIVII